jgi:CheY-like chemotaxis protein
MCPEAERGGAASSERQIFVLVVEDDPILLWLAMDVVAEAGYEGIEARNADEAIQILEARTDIRIVFTDVEMPGTLDGIKFAQAVRGRWPPIELIIVSGWTKLSDQDIPERGRFFSKPYKPEEIIEALHQLAA